MIISASKRTDIPAFFGEWFINNLRNGLFLVRNPLFPKKVSRIVFTPSDVECIVFWTKNPRPFFKYLDEIEQNYRYYFSYTLNNYPNNIETNLPSLRERLDTFKALSIRIGSNRVIWRYDPILFTDLIDIDYHIESFRTIAQELHGYTDRVIISIVDWYARNNASLQSIKCRRITSSELEILMNNLKVISAEFGLTIQSCAENNLQSYGIEKGSCISDALINKLFDINIKAPSSNERDDCLCAQNVDIGAYNTCLHNCVYCYANYSRESVIHNVSKHSACSPMIIGEVGNEDIVGEKKVQKYEKKLKEIAFNFDDLE